LALGGSSRPAAVSKRRLSVFGVEPLVTPEVELNRFFFLGKLISLTASLLLCLALTAPSEKHQ
jgi:hypothetical protein